MSAIRAARGYAGRDKVLKFEGCYHGHSDGFLIKAGSGAMTFSVPDSPGVPRGTAAETLTLPFNDLSAVERLLREHPRSVAAMIVEPVVGNMGCVPPRAGYLEGLRKFCTQEGIVLIFDEVITGFRVARGGAQELLGVLPDLTTLGKVIGGGLPVGAYGGRREIMELVAPSGPMYQAGTLSGNPLAMAAGLETLKILCEEPEFYRQLELRSKRLAEGILKNVNSLCLWISFNRVGSLSTLFFSDRQVVDSVTALTSDTRRFGAYFRSMLDQGVYLPPSQFEAAFVSRAHTEEDVDRTIDANRFALQAAFA
jgi:glutamate-1-semialdehyde 2,1-aminomutase